MGPNVIIALWRNMKLIFDPFVLKVADMTLECSWRCMCTAVWKLHCEHCEEHWTVSWMWYIMSLESIAKTHLLLWHSLAQHSTWTALIVPCETIVVVRHICLYTLVLVVYTMQKHTQPIACIKCQTDYISYAGSLDLKYFWSSNKCFEAILSFCL